MSEGLGTAGAAAAGNAGTVAANTAGNGTAAENAAGSAGAASGGERDFHAEFDELVKGDYKEAYDRRMQQAIKERLKGSKQTESRLKEAEELLGLVGERYQLDGKDLAALRKAVEGDRQYLEAEAMEKGLTIEQLAQIKQMERENRYLREMQQQEAQRQAFERKYAGWAAEAEALKGTYPELNLQQEFANPIFIKMLDNGVDVKTAYQAVHFDDLMSGALQHTAAQTEKKVLDGIKARGVRPTENGMSGSTAARETFDVKKLTKEQRAELIERARRNPDERISFV